MTEQEQKQQMIELAKSLFERGYTVGGAGNLSVRLDENRVLITPTGSSLGRLNAERLAIGYCAELGSFFLRDNYVEKDFDTYHLIHIRHSDKWLHQADLSIKLNVTLLKKRTLPVRFQDIY